MQSVGELVEGLRKLRTGALLSIVSTILAFVGLAVIFASVGFAVSTDPNAIMAMLGTAAIGLGLLAATLVLSLIAFILWFMATGHFKRHDPVKLGIGRLGMILVVVGIILVLAMMVVDGCYSCRSCCRKPGSIRVCFDGRYSDCCTGRGTGLCGSDTIRTYADEVT